MSLWHSLMLQHRERMGKICDKNFVSVAERYRLKAYIQFFLTFVMDLFVHGCHWHNVTYS